MCADEERVSYINGYLCEHCSQDQHEVGWYQLTSCRRLHHAKVSYWCTNTRDWRGRHPPNTTGRATEYTLSGRRMLHFAFTINAVSEGEVRFSFKRRIRMNLGMTMRDSVSRRKSLCFWLIKVACKNFFVRDCWTHVHENEENSSFSSLVGDQAQYIHWRA